MAQRVIGRSDPRDPTPLGARTPATESRPGLRYGVGDRTRDSARIGSSGCRLRNGFIAHHLSAILGISVLGIDLEENSDAPIDYRRYDGAQFPVSDRSFDAVTLCYVLHHAQDVHVVLS